MQFANMPRSFVRFGSRFIMVVLFLAAAKVDAAPIEIIELPTPGKGVVYFRIMVHAGSMHDPKGKEGLAQFTVDLLKRGAGGMNRKQIESQLDQIGARLYTHVQKEFTMIIGTCLKSAVPQFYPILSSILTAPNFPAVQIEVTKRDQLDNITTLKNDNEDLGLEAFTHLLYAGTSWEHSAVGTVRSIKSFTRKDAEDFFNTYYLANNLTVGVAGDYDNDLVARLRTDLGRLPHHPLADADVPHPTITGRKVLILEKEGLEQGQINIGHPLNVNRQNSDFPALYIANQHFGSHRTFTGILMNEIRSDRGLTYGAYSYIEYFPYPYHSGAGMLPMPNIARSQQDWRMWTFTLSKNMDFTVRLMLLKFQELLKNGISEERFKKIQSYAQDKFVFLVETTERQIAMKLDDKVYGTEDFARTFQQRLADTTYEQFNAALKKHLSLDNLAVVVTVPHAQAFKAELLSPSATIEYQGNIDSKPLAKEDNAAKALDLKLQETDIKVITADQLFE